MSRLVRLTNLLVRTSEARRLGQLSSLAFFLEARSVLSSHRHYSSLALLFWLRLLLLFQCSCQLFYSSSWFGGIGSLSVLLWFSEFLGNFIIFGLFGEVFFFFFSAGGLSLLFSLSDYIHSRACFFGGSLWFFHLPRSLRMQLTCSCRV